MVLFKWSNSESVQKNMLSFDNYVIATHVIDVDFMSFQVIMQWAYFLVWMMDLFTIEFSYHVLSIRITFAVIHLNVCYAP